MLQLTSLDSPPPPKTWKTVRPNGRRRDLEDCTKVAINAASSARSCKRIRPE
jgi:hypothetical protein